MQVLIQELFENYYLMLDNVHLYFVSILSNWLEGIGVLQWPSQSTEHSPIDCVWDMVQRRIITHSANIHITVNSRKMCDLNGQLYFDKKRKCLQFVKMSLDFSYMCIYFHSYCSLETSKWKSVWFLISSKTCRIAQCRSQMSKHTCFLFTCYIFLHPNKFNYPCGGWHKRKMVLDKCYDKKKPLEEISYISTV